MEEPEGYVQERDQEDPTGGRGHAAGGVCVYLDPLRGHGLPQGSDCYQENFKVYQI